MSSLRQFSLTLGAFAALAIVSCDKVKGLADTAKAWISDEKKGGSDGQVVEVQSVDQAKGEDIIANESRLVMVEYYSDT